jgi:DNA-directed RNA polymerase subunit RPC12/RpoP
MERLIRNRIKCLNCGDIIESTHRNHSVNCSCKRLIVDGGLDYARVVGNLEEYEDLSIWMSSNTLPSNSLKPQNPN